MSNLFGGLLASAAALALGAIALGAALLMPGGNQVAPPQSAVVQECVGPDCMSYEEIESLVGFIPLEPRSLPEGYVLYARHVLQDEIPLEARKKIAEARGVHLSEVPTVAPPTTVHIEYRFRARPYVPVINITQVRDNSAGQVLLRMEREDCGEELSVNGRVVFYGEGYGSVLWADMGQWVTCPNTSDGALGNAVFVDGDVVVELKVPLDHLSQDEILEIIRSM